MLSDYQKALKRAERERHRMMKEHQLETERKKKLEEKEMRLREKQAKRDEEERAKEERRQRRREEQRKRDEEKEAERKRKEDEKRKKEEERLQKEQDKKREEDFKTKREEKQRAVLLGFLVKSEQRREVTPSAPAPCGPFMQFVLRKDMKMAPLHRVPPALLKSKQSNLDELLQSWSGSANEHTASSLGLTKFGRTSYLHELKTKQHVPLSCPSTWPIEPPDAQLLGDGLCSIANSPTLKYHGSRGSGGTVWLRAKWLQFVENYRPAYYGTWRRRSRIVNGRRPFAQDHTKLDYTVDSDDEWEEEEPGESITQSENDEEEDDKDAEEEEDEDDHFFVPHGYLSDDEGVAVEEACGEEEVGAEEMKKLRRCLSMAEYEVAHRRGMQRLKPLVFGPVWLQDPCDLGTNSADTSCVNDLDEDDDKENVENAGVCGFSSASTEKMGLKIIRAALSTYRAYLWEELVPITVRLDAPATPSSTRRPRRELPEDAVPYLIHLVHKSPLGKLKLAFEFRVFWHKHTTGSMPECVQYAEFKRYNATGCNAHLQRGGPVLTGPAWDSLALSQNLVLSKLSEIAVFEDGRWAVHPEVIRRFQSRLATVTGSNELRSFLPDAEDATVAELSFPPWEFLTDVATTKRRPGRISIAKRRSLEVPVTTEVGVGLLAAESKEGIPASLVEHDSLRVLLQPLVLAADAPSAIPKSHRSAPSKSRELRRAPLSVVQSTQLPDPSPLKSIDSAVAIDSSVEDQKILAVSRKRVTLETFFTPPTKRPHKRLETSDTTGAIIIDSD
ncbi:hypothetical protein P879_09036 [Paragonimus westermani]|uniref:Chromatin assembly factor 1 subunit A n=1 Tax=Paragonimus westermani TaxID=34504 RepID=A0A8T0DAZ0_9TREM|nr:hypothetical protein P879_09036 [Paragonimus westermani]